MDDDGAVPLDIGDQCRLVWRNVKRQLEAAEMGLPNLVKITVYLSDRRYIQAAYASRAEVLGPGTLRAMTILIAGIYDENWLLEIEAIAVA